jgi:hypothetical protein
MRPRDERKFQTRSERSLPTALGWWMVIIFEALVVSIGGSDWLLCDTVRF